MRLSNADSLCASLKFSLFLYRPIGRVWNGIQAWAGYTQVRYSILCDGIINIHNMSVRCVDLTHELMGCGKSFVLIEYQWYALFSFYMYIFIPIDTWLFTVRIMHPSRVLSHFVVCSVHDRAVRRGQLDGTLLGNQPWMIQILSDGRGLDFLCPQNVWIQISNCYLKTSLLILFLY